MTRDADDDDDRIELSPVRVESTWKQVIDVYRGGILADWYVLLLMPAHHPFSHAQHARKSLVQTQMVSPSQSKMMRRTLIFV